MDKKLRQKFLSQSLQSSRKSYYPQLQNQLAAAKENERQLQLLIDNMPARISYVDEHQRYVFANLGFEEAFRRHRQQIIGRKVETIVEAQNYARIKPHIEAALAGKRVHFETSFSDYRGRPQWLEIIFVPDKDGEGRTRGFYSLTIDQTEKKQTEKKLRHKDQLLKEIGALMKIGGWEFDPVSGRGTYTDEVAHIFDLPADEEFRLAESLKLFHGESRTKMEAAIKSAVENAQPWDLVLDIISANGIHKWGRIIGQPIIDNGAVVQVKGSLQDITDKVKAEQAHLASEERFRLLLENAHDAIFVRTRGCFAYVNTAAIRLFGVQTAADLVGTPVIERFHPDCREQVAERIENLDRKRQPVPNMHQVCLRQDGTTVDVEASAIPMNFEGDDGALVFLRDISARLAAEKEQQRLQEQLYQAQKMESIGTLAGGVAHDYNNFLSVIIGYTQLSLNELTPGHKLHQNLEEVLKAAYRSKTVTGQLLAFARKETISPEVLNLNATVEHMLKMIRRLIGENIDLLWHPKAGLWPIEMDPSQIDQILANLCVNARDAIDNVGKIVIETKNITVDDTFRTLHPNLQAGEYVSLVISDDGCGMDAETKNRIFDPFFTTKAMGKGTGLGLSTVYGIVKQNKGTISVSSLKGAGTSFTIYLPRYEGTAVQPQKTDVVEIPRGRGETILLVEDEGMILELGKEILDYLDYRVLTANSPEKALELANDFVGAISLVITDVVMPGMNGRELMAQLEADYGTFKVIYMSGYTDDIIAESGVLKPGIKFLQKPFSPKDLAVKVREVLDAT